MRRLQSRSQDDAQQWKADWGSEVLWKICVGERWEARKVCWALEGKMVRLETPTPRVERSGSISVTSRWGWRWRQEEAR